MLSAKGKTIDTLTTADKFSKVTPMENGDEGLVTCHSKEQQKQFNKIKKLKMLPSISAYHCMIITSLTLAGHIPHEPKMYLVHVIGGFC